MNHSSSGVSNFFKGMGAGVVTAVAVTVVGKCVINNNKGVAKGSAKVMKAVGDFVDGVQTMIH